MYQFDSNDQLVSSALLEGEATIALPSQSEPDCPSEDSLCPPEVDGERKVTPFEQQLAQWLGNLLACGVAIASATVLVGGVLYLIRHGAEPADYHFFQGEPTEFCSPAGVVKSVLSGRRRGIIQLGLLLLIATPVTRVAFSLFAFLWQRDFTYVIVTLLVLTGLIYSFIGAYS